MALSEEDPILLNVHTICIESLPEVRAGRRMEWLETHAAMTLSARERRIRHPTMTSTDGLLNLKENLHSLFVSLSIPSGSADQIFALRHSTTGKIYALIFATTVRLDLSAQTVVADTHILPIARPLPTIVDKFLRKNSTPVRNLLVSDDGVKLWSSFLAVSVERSRKNIWGHLLAHADIKPVGGSQYLRFPRHLLFVAVVLEKLRQSLETTRLMGNSLPTSSSRARLHGSFLGANLLRNVADIFDHS